MQPDASPPRDLLGKEPAVDPSREPPEPVARSATVLRIVQPEDRVGQPAGAAPATGSPTTVPDDVLDLLIATMVEASGPWQRALIINDLVEEMWSTIGLLQTLGEPSDEVESFARLVVLSRAHREAMHPQP